MGRSRKWTVTGALVAASMFGIASCGGGSSVSEQLDGTDDTEQTGGEQPDGGGDSGDTDLGDISNDCARAGAAFTAALESFDDFGTAVAGGEISVDLDALRSDIESARDAVPSEIRGAYDAYMGAFLDYAEVLNGLDPQDYSDPAILDRLGQAAASFSSAEILDAINDLTEYFTQECGLTDFDG